QQAELFEPLPAVVGLGHREAELLQQPTQDQPRGPGVVDHQSVHKGVPFCSRLADSGTRVAGQAAGVSPRGPTPSRASFSRMTSRVNGFMTSALAPASRARTTMSSSASVVTIIRGRPS